MRPFSRETTYFSFLKSILLLMIFSVGLSFGGNVFAMTWDEPTKSPPLENIPAPLNVGTHFGNEISDLTNTDIIGNWDHLKIKINPCKNGQVLMWSTTSPYLATGQVYCGDPFSGGYWQLNGTNLYPNSLNYRIGIGTATPNRDLHVYNTSTNAEIDIQSVSGSNNHWGLYVNKTDNSFNIWGGSNALTISRTGNSGFGTVSPTFAKVQIISSTTTSPRPLFVQGSSGVRHTAAFSNIDGYGVALGSMDDKTYGLIQSAKFASGGGELGANVPLILNQAAGSYVGIGTVNPSAKLEVNGEVMIGDPVDPVSVSATHNLIYGNIGATSTGNLLLLQKSAVTKFFVDSDGNVSSSGWINAPQLCISNDCRSAWPVVVGGGGGGDSFWATSTIDSNNIYNKNTGNVGIGTNSPIGKLDVGGFIATKVAPAIYPVVFISDNVNAISGLEMSNRNTGTLADFRFMITDDTGHYFSFSSPGKNNNGTMFGLARKTTDLIFNIAGTARDMAIGTLNATHLIFGTNGLERMRITKDGNVGIGTTAPKTDLEVIGVVSTTDLRANGSVVTNYVWGAAGVPTENIYLGDGGDNIIVQGTVSSTNIKASQICLSGDCITNWPIATGGGSVDSFWATSTNPNNIYNKNSGNVAIGAAVPAAGVKLDINGGIKIGASTGGETAGTISYSDNNFWGFNGSIWRSLAVGSYIGVTPSTYSGNQGGYKNADLVCRNTVLANSHVCSVEEIFNSIRLNVSIPAVNAWINNGAPGSNSNTGNDCIGWTSNQPTDIAVFWRFNVNGGSALLTACNQSLVFACCK